MNTKIITLIVLGIGAILIVGAYLMNASPDAAVVSEGENAVPTSTSSLQQVATSSPTQPKDTRPLTVEQVLNGLNQCGIQFKNGEYTLTEEKYTETLAKYFDASSKCFAASGFKASNIMLGDFDNDGTLEALVPGWAHNNTGGGIIYVFKQVNGEAKVVSGVVLGKGEVKILWVKNSIVLVEYMDQGAHGLVKLQTSYRFIDNQLAFPFLTDEEAMALVEQAWGGCGEGKCAKLTVSLSKPGDMWYVTAIYSGLYDDSITAEKKVAPVRYENKKWVLGQSETTQQCAPGRGHRDFSKVSCL